MTKGERFEDCILGGAIGDAYGSGYENLPKEKETLFYPFGINAFQAKKIV